VSYLLGFWLLSFVTGNPLLAALLVVAFWWSADRVTFGLLPDPFRHLARFRRRAELRRTLGENPHDRRARFELAELLLDQGRPRAAVETLRPNVEAGDDDVYTAFTMGAAMARAGFFPQAEQVLGAAKELDAGFRDGEIDLELGRMRLASGDLAGARASLERLLATRPGSVEGRYWLAQALAGEGDAEGARRLREEAWREYAQLPRFRRRAERWFAWRCQPWRPVVVGAVVVLLVIGVGSAVCGGAGPG
jgi:tetratricopeptide (TPR) repeat protein